MMGVAFIQLRDASQVVLWLRDTILRLWLMSRQTGGGQAGGEHNTDMLAGLREVGVLPGRR